MNRLQRKQSEYPWMVIICCFLMVFTALGFCSSPKQLFLKATTEALNIDRTLYSFNTTFRYAALAVMNLVFATLVYRVRTRILVGFGFACLIVSTLCYAMADSVILIYAGGTLLGVGMCFTANTMANYIITARCKKNTGTILGFVMASNGLGGAVATQMIGRIIDDNAAQPFAYRNAYYLVAIILAVVGVFVIIFLKDEKTAEPVVKKTKKARGQGWDGITYAEGKKKSYFLPTAICLFLTGFVLSGINGISVTHAKDVGVDPTFVNNIWSVHSLVLMGSKFFVGFMYDRKGLRTCLLICQITSLVVLAALALVNPTPFGMAMWVIYAIFSSLALPLETIGVSLVVGDVFGNKEFGKYLGLMSALNSIGFAVGDPIMNLVNTVFHSYTIAIWIAVGIIAAVLVAFQFILNVAHKDREKIMAARAEA